MSSRQPISWTPLVAATAVIVLSATSIGVLVAARHVARSSATPLSDPSASPIVLPGTAQLSAPSTNVVWVLVNFDHLYRSTDRGGHWEQRPTPAQRGVQPVISFVDEHEGWLLAPDAPVAQCRTAGAVVWHTTDGGLTWEQLHARGLASSQCKTYISFADSKRGFVGAWDVTSPATVYRTSDGGESWAATKLLPDPPNFQSEGGGIGWQVSWVKAFGSNSYLRAIGTPYIYKSTDGGASWKWFTKVGSPAVVMVTETRWLDLSMPGRSMESVNVGQQFHPYDSDFNTDTPVGGPQIVFADASVGYAEGRGALQRTLDGGLHWTRLATPGLSFATPSQSPETSPSSPARINAPCTPVASPPTLASWQTYRSSEFGFTISYPTGYTFKQEGSGFPAEGWLIEFRAVDSCYLNGYPPGQIEMGIYAMDADTPAAFVQKHSVGKPTAGNFFPWELSNFRSVTAAGQDAVSFEQAYLGEGGPFTVYSTVTLLKSGYVFRIDWWSNHPEIASTIEAIGAQMLASLGD